MPGSGREFMPMSGSSRETNSEFLKWSGDASKCEGVVGRPFRMSGCCWEALPVVLERLGGPPGCPDEVGRPFRISGSGPGCPP